MQTPTWGAYCISLWYSDVTVNTEGIDYSNINNNDTFLPGEESTGGIIPSSVFLLQEPNSFIEIAESCFSRRELRYFCKHDVIMSFTPLVDYEGTPRQICRIDIENKFKEIKSKNIKATSFYRMCIAFCDHFKFNDGGFNKLVNRKEVLLERAFSLHFSPDGTVTVFKDRFSVPWLYDPKKTKDIERWERAGLQFY